MQKKSKITHHHLHGIRVVLFGLLAISLFAVRVNPAALNAVVSVEPGSVLAYATNISRADLLQGTNSHRAQNGLGPLLLDGQLNSSAQSKAQHMVDNNYWAHNAPDGTQPWFFFDQAGYNYTSAGENLAYGFDNSNAVTTGWINSPSHNANILGNYADVGFGYVNGATFQGGNNTVVVAHYGSQPSSTPPAAPAAPAPPPPPATTAPAAASPAAPVVEAVPVPVEAAPGSGAAANETPPSGPVPAVGSLKTSAPEAAKPVTVLQQLQSGNISLLALGSLSLLGVSGIGYVLTHRALIRQAIKGGEKFIVRHPAFDAVAAFTVAVLVLTTTVGYIG